MQYYGLKSILASGKTSIPMKTTSDAFYIAESRDDPYIEPEFSKVFYDEEKPTIILVSAVGATGKSALANVLSHGTGLPLLDLGKYKPVGANSLTGLLTSSFDSKDLSTVFTGLEQGTFGVIIDGIDEARAKTTRMGFEAFLDDIVQRCGLNDKTSFILLGRTQALDDCYLYLIDRKIQVGLINILPFNLDQARQYIDSFTSGMTSPFKPQYEQARDVILRRLKSAFGAKADEDNFLSFIGYPPVLDAIVTLLEKEKNYHKLLSELGDDTTDNVEVDLLFQIANYILKREKDEKIIPNIIEPIMAGVPQNIQAEARRNVFEAEEQSYRLISFCNGKQVKMDTLDPAVLNEKYEEQLASFLPEHPFLHGNEFRNTIFESVTLAILIASSSTDNYQKLIYEYMQGRKNNYYLVYLLNKTVKEGLVPVEYLDLLVNSSFEFRSNNSSVELHIDGPELNDIVPDSHQPTEVEIEIEILLGKEKGTVKSFEFRTYTDDETRIYISKRLSGAYITIPCNIVFRDPQELEFTAPLNISAREVSIQSKLLTLRANPSYADQSISIEANKIESTLENITTNAIPLYVFVHEASGIAFPVVQYVTQIEPLPSDSNFTKKFLRLKRILLELRSHSRGALARHKSKIESERVLRNDVGEAVLKKLVRDGVLFQESGFYYLDPNQMHIHLGTSWNELKNNHISEKLSEYLGSIS